MWLFFTSIPVRSFVWLVAFHQTSHCPFPDPRLTRAYIFALSFHLSPLPDRWFPYPSPSAPFVIHINIHIGFESSETYHFSH